MILNGPDGTAIPLVSFGKGWLAVDKPAGMSVHNDPGRDLCSVASDFMRLTEVQRQIEPDPAFGVSPAHRLDRETSGVIVLACSRPVFRYFSGLFENRQVTKRYVALVHGWLEPPPDGGAWGAWSWPLSKAAGGRANPQGTGERQESRTLYRVLSHSAHYTMVELEPLTGRVHQIRRHAKLAGRPVVGDARYGSSRAIEYLRRNHAFNRLALHAQSLTLLPPGAGEPQTIQSPTVPKAITDLFEKDGPFLQEA